jgi:nitrogen-specific signal transduction histidine kinase
MTQPDLRSALADEDRQLAHLRSTVHRLLDQISHDFRTPLTVIKEYATLMRDGLVGAVAPRQREFLDVIGDRADDLAAMVDNVLDAGKLDAGVLRLWRRPTDVAQPVAGLTPSLARKTAAAGARLETAVRHDLPAVYADQDHLGRALASLAVCALNSVERPDVVRLWAVSAVNAGGVRIGVTVEGGRLGAEQLETIGAALDDVPPCHTRRAGGFALRLATARQLVECHGGRIEFRRGPGAACAFSLTLPAGKPGAVLRAYLRHLASKPIPPRRATLVAASTSPQTKSAAAGVVDEFLQSSVGADDLAVQVDGHRWLLLVLGPRIAARGAMEQLDAAWSDTLKHRPAGLLPAIQWTELGRWNLAADAAALLDHFDGRPTPSLDTAPEPATLAAVGD